MKVLDIVETIVDGPHLRTSIYFAGCSIHCKGCHNKSSWDFNQGVTYSSKTLLEAIKKFNNNYVTLSGGNPIEQPDNELLEFLRELKSNGYNVWLYSGYTLQHILNDSTKRKILEYIDVLVDGPFVESLKDTSLPFRGSSNQKIWDIKKSLELKEWVKYDYN